MAQHPSPPRRGLAGRIPSPGFETFGGIFGFIYTFLAGNVMMALANAPLVLCLALVADPVAAWPFFLALSVTVPPSLAGLFASFQALNDDGAAAKPVASFLRGYRRGFRRAAPLGLAAVALLLFLGVDLAIVQSMPAAAILVPVIVVAAAITASVAAMAVAGVVILPDAGLKNLLKASLYLAVQRWYLSLAMLVLLGIIASAALLQPVLGVALAPAPLLFVVWSNAAYAFSAALRTP
ncbi:putative membrane protein YesL [Arthrobacter ulcerisalmonis]|nr:putative membrane protein YesL [Arthrobacter ulcerisalmonis]